MASPEDENLIAMFFLRSQNWFPGYEKSQRYFRSFFRSSTI